MTGLEQIRALYEYNEWANDHLLAIAEGLSEEELKRELVGSFGSVEGNLWHTLSTQVFWLAAWRQSQPEGMQQPGEGGTIAAIREAYRISHEGLRQFVASLSGEDTESAITFPMSGKLQQLPLGKIMLQVANHGMHHRAETAMMLTQLGKPPRPLDYIRFELERS